MIAILCLLQFVRALTVINVPAGAKLRIRMDTPVASWSSAADTPISAVLIAPVLVKGRLALPAGSILVGRISSITRVGLGIRHERASVGLEFTSLTLPGGGSNALAARVTQVDNGREHVISSGLIQGIRATGSISYRVCGYIKMILLWHLHAELAEWAIKSLIVQLPEPEIYYPAGTELTLSVTSELRVAAPIGPAREPEQLAGSDLLDVRDLVTSMPFRTSDPESGRHSDLTNVLLVGSKSQIEAAFRAAGWNLARPLSLRSRIGYIRAAAETRGYSAPMSSLLLNGAEADMCWQKGLNDVSQRHHIRVWKQPGLWKGQELWTAAATHDVNFAYLRPGRTFTHRIDPNIDEEREKVANDLAFTTCATPVAWIERSAVPHSAENGTGDSFVTDSRLAVVRFNDCSAEPSAIETAAPLPLIARGGKWQRLVRREILVTRSDLLRANLYWRIFEGARWTYDYARDRHMRSLQSASLLADPSLSADPLTHRQALRLALLSLQ